MSEPSQKLQDFDFIVSRIGMPAVILGVILWFLYSDYRLFKRDIQWKLERSIRNERAMVIK